MDETLRPIGARVLIRVKDESDTTRGGIVIPDMAKEKPQRGEVVAVGDDEMIKVRPGDLVLYPRYSGTSLRIGGVEHLIIDANDLLGVFGEAADAQ